MRYKRFEDLPVWNTAIETRNRRLHAYLETRIRQTLQLKRST
jgi:hypothetical protein